jgi:hypothetical protein
MSDLRQLIVDVYGLDNDDKDLICLRYTTYSRNNVQAEVKVMGDEDTLENKRLWQQDGLEQELTIADFDLFLRLPAGIVITEDINCDSNYTLQVTPLISAAICQQMPFEPQDETIYLVMDNAGGHGTEEATGEYTVCLQDDYHVEIIFQAAQSPEVNALDFGLWMSIQSWVQKQQFQFHKMTIADALTVSVKEAWQKLP